MSISSLLPLFSLVLHNLNQKIHYPKKKVRKVRIHYLLVEGGNHRKWKVYRVLTEDLNRIPTLDLISLLSFP